MFSTQSVYWSFDQLLRLCNLLIGLTHQWVGATIRGGFYSRGYFSNKGALLLEKMQLIDILLIIQDKEIKAMTLSRQSSFQ